MDERTYQYLQPTEAQIKAMAELREAAKEYSDVLEAILPDGPDKTWCIRNHRTTAMWANVAVDRNPDGSPRA